MRIMLFGAGGQVGGAFAEAAPPGVELVRLSHAACDIRDGQAVGDAIRRNQPDLVVNAAGYTAVDRAEAEPELAQAVNGEAPRDMAEAAAASGARMVHLSTDFVFDGQGGRPYRPDDPTTPLSVYGLTKRMGEEAVLEVAPDALIVRTAWVYSAGTANFLTTMLRLMGERDRLTIIADQVGTPTHAASLARALWRLAGAGAKGIHHFTDAGVASWYDFAVAIQEEALAARLLSREAEIVPIGTSDYPTPARRPAFSVLDKSATWALLGGPATHWRSELRACLAQVQATAGRAAA